MCINRIFNSFVIVFIFFKCLKVGNGLGMKIVGGWIILGIKIVGVYVVVIY